VPGWDSTLRAARPAEALIGLPLSVPLAHASSLRGLRLASRGDIASARPTMAGRGKPPEIALP